MQTPPRWTFEKMEDRHFEKSPTIRTTESIISSTIANPLLYLLFYFSSPVFCSFCNEIPRDSTLSSTFRASNSSVNWSVSASIARACSGVEFSLPSFLAGGVLKKLPSMARTRDGDFGKTGIGKTKQTNRRSVTRRRVSRWALQTQPYSRIRTIGFQVYVTFSNCAYTRRHFGDRRRHVTDVEFHVGHVLPT